MPIKPENRARYPREWLQIVARIRERSGDRCECRGECGDTHPWMRCNAPHGAIVLRDELQPQRWRKHSPCGACVGGEPNHKPIKIILTVAHRDHTPENCSDENLAHWCQRCHLKYDAKHHVSTARETRRAAKACGELFG
jgi:hypothetical protein